MRLFVDLGPISRSIVAKQCNQSLSLLDVINVLFPRPMPPSGWVATSKSLGSLIFVKKHRVFIFLLLILFRIYTTIALRLIASGEEGQKNHHPTNFSELIPVLWFIYLCGGSDVLLANFFQVELPLRADCLNPPPVCHLKLKASFK